MPQNVPKINIYIRWGAYWPSTGFHVETDDGLTAANALDLGGALTNFLTTDVVVTHWEGVAPDGSVLTGGPLNLPGLLVADFDDFRDCTHVTWRSPGGTLRPSGNFIPGRNDALWTKGVAHPDLATSMSNLLTAMTNSAVTDSEGFAITSWTRYTPSRRPNMRVAP